MKTAKWSWADCSYIISAHLTKDTRIAAFSHNDVLLAKFTNHSLYKIWLIRTVECNVRNDRYVMVMSCSDGRSVVLGTSVMLCTHCDFLGEVLCSGWSATSVHNCAPSGVYVFRSGEMTPTHRISWTLTWCSWRKTTVCHFNFDFDLGPITSSALISLARAAFAPASYLSCLITTIITRFQAQLYKNTVLSQIQAPQQIALAVLSFCSVIAIYKIDRAHR